MKILKLTPGEFYKIELEPRVDREQLRKNGVAKIFIPETDGRWVNLEPIAEPNDEHQEAVTSDGLNGEFS